MTLEKVTVIDRPLPDPSVGGILGEHGVVIWRTSYFLEKSRLRTSGWLYVVYFPQPNTYECIKESRLLPTGEVVSLESCLGCAFEISYDRDGAGPDAIKGVFRIPGGFWNTFEFRSTAVEELSYEIRVPARLQAAGIGKYYFAVPQSVLLDSHYVEETMSKVFDAKSWRRIAGPQSQW